MRSLVHCCDLGGIARAGARPDDIAGQPNSGAVQFVQTQVSQPNRGVYFVDARGWFGTDNESVMLCCTSQEEDALAHSLGPARTQLKPVQKAGHIPACSRRAIQVRGRH